LSQRGRGFAHALARKCWVKERKSLFLAPQACAYPAEREERNNKKWFLMPVAQIQSSTSVVKMLCTVTLTFDYTTSLP
jgi:hypothetical protein